MKEYASVPIKSGPATKRDTYPASPGFPTTRGDSPSQDTPIDVSFSSFRPDPKHSAPVADPIYIRLNHPQEVNASPSGKPDQRSTINDQQYPPPETPIDVPFKLNPTTEVKTPHVDPIHIRLNQPQEEFPESAPSSPTSHTFKTSSTFRSVWPSNSSIFYMPNKFSWGVPIWSLAETDGAFLSEDSPFFSDVRRGSKSSLGYLNDDQDRNEFSLGSNRRFEGADYIDWALLEALLIAQILGFSRLKVRRQIMFFGTADELFLSKQESMMFIDESSRSAVLMKRQVVRHMRFDDQFRERILCL